MRMRVLRLAERVVPAEASRPEGHLVLLDPELRRREEAVARPVVVVQMADERDRDVGDLHAHALHHDGGPHVVADAALLDVVLLEPGVQQHRVRAAEDQPDEVVQRDRLVRVLTVEESAGGRVAFGVLERVDLVHGLSVGWDSRSTILAAAAAHRERPVGACRHDRSHQ